MLRLARIVAVACAWTDLGSGAGVTPAPVLYSDPFHESAVRGHPGDLLVLAGDALPAGGSVVYVHVDDSAPLVHPPVVPTINDADLGVAAVVSEGDLPHSVVVRLAPEMLADTTYALWIVAGDGEWSNGVRINDARPLWVTPPFLYLQAVDWRAREFKLVGRNLNPAPAASTRVRLRRHFAIQTYEMSVTTADPALARHVVLAQLPAKIGPGEYVVSVSRDGGASWVELSSQTLSIKPNPPAPPVFDVAQYGCTPDDGTPDTDCVKTAIAAAASAGGGVVQFGPGSWLLDSAHVPDPNNGISVPRGVWLRGAGAGLTTVDRQRDWTPWAVFTLEGSNQVSGIRFHDAKKYEITDAANPKTFFMLGRRPAPGGPGLVEDIVFYGNVFSRPYWAITNGFVPVRRLTLRGNEFGAYRDSIFFIDSPTRTPLHFQLEDAVIVGNTFKPGAYSDTSIHQGATASQIGASSRLDFSDNIADGRATDYLDPFDVRGWRAAFFFHADNNHERLLVSKNVASCTGDKDGDGEFIAFDSNRNLFAFEDVARVTAGTRDSVALAGTADRTISPDYYAEHWAQVVSG